MIFLYIPSYISLNLVGLLKQILLLYIYCNCKANPYKGDIKSLS